MIYLFKILGYYFNRINEIKNMSIAQIKANYFDIKSGIRKTKKQQILKHIEKSKTPISVGQLHIFTGFKESTIVGRLSELSDEGKIVEQCKYSNSYYSFVHSKELTKQLKEKKKKERTKRVLKALINDDEALKSVVIILKEVGIETDVMVITNRIIKTLDADLNDKI